jgi:hypothetical protein
MHIALANSYLLSVTGPKMPADIKSAGLRSKVKMGQLIAYARMNGIAPPWSESGGK